MGASGSRASLFCDLKHCTLWKTNRSPACRAVLMALDAMQLSITEIDVDMDQNEHKSPVITSMNQLQTLPIFKDRGLVLCDSHAICAYLASRYCVSGPCARMYPSDPGGRALVHQLMCYNCGVLYPRYRNAVDPILYENCNFLMPQQVYEIECAYTDLQVLLGKREWFGGSWPTLGDVTIGATVSTLNTVVPIYRHRYPNLDTWLCRFADQPFYTTANKKGLGEFIHRIGELSEIET